MSIWSQFTERGWYAGNRVRSVPRPGLVHIKRYTWQMRVTVVHMTSNSGGISIIATSFSFIFFFTFHLLFSITDAVICPILTAWIRGDSFEKDFIISKEGISNFVNWNLKCYVFASHISLGDISRRSWKETKYRAECWNRMIPWLHKSSRSERIRKF